MAPKPTAQDAQIQDAPIMDAVVLTDEQKAIEEARKIVEAKNKLEQAAKISDLNKAIDKARSDLKTWVDIQTKADAGDAISKAVMTVVVAQEGESWKDKFNAEIAASTRALADYRLSLMPEGQRKFMSQINDLDAQIKTLTEKRTSVLAEATAKYPDFNGTAPKQRTPGTPSTGTPKAGIVPFTGTLNTLKEDTEEVKRLHESGTTSESDIIRSIYGDGFTISGDKEVNVGNGNPRSRIHSIRVTLGYTK